MNSLPKIRIQPLTLEEVLANKRMFPIMYLASGYWWELPIRVIHLFFGYVAESPQQTHRWNNTKLRQSQVEYLNRRQMITGEAVPGACERWWYKLPIFHLPIFGGWREYVVLEPVHPIENWHVGWIAPDVVGVSRIQLQGPVRVLRGKHDVFFFGIDADGNQVPLREVVRGRIGIFGEYSYIILL